jgi:hypothetical protein
MATKKTLRKAQKGESVKGVSWIDKAVKKNAGTVSKTTKTRTTAGGLLEPYEYKTTSIDTTGYAAGKPTYQLKTVTGQGDKATGSKPTGSSTKTVNRNEVPAVLKTLKKSKKGGATKDDKWIQKAVNPKHKGYCTPMSKPTCTPKRKALARTFKAMAKKK